MQFPKLLFSSVFETRIWKLIMSLACSQLKTGKSFWAHFRQHLFSSLKKKDTHIFYPKRDHVSPLLINTQPAQERFSPFPCLHEQTYFAGSWPNCWVLILEVNPTHLDWNPGSRFPASALRIEAWNLMLCLCTQSRIPHITGCGKIHSVFFLVNRIHLYLVCR